MICKLCSGTGRLNLPLGYAFCDCEDGRKRRREDLTRERPRCEYCGKGFQNWNIGKLLGGVDKWGCNDCCDKLVRKKK